MSHDPKTTHTPGPWAVTNPVPAARRPIEVVACNGEHRTHVAKVTCTFDHEQSANARLIAAAPEMLEALEIVRMWMEEHGLTQPLPTTDGGTIEHPMRTCVREAIAKATGA